MLFVIGLGPSRNFPLSGNSYTCCRRGRPWASRGGDLHAELAYGDHPSDEVAIHKNVCSDVVHGRALVFDFIFRRGYRGASRVAAGRHPRTQTSYRSRPFFCERGRPDER